MIKKLFFNSGVIDKMARKTKVFLGLFQGSHVADPAIAVTTVIRRRNRRRRGGC